MSTPTSPAPEQPNPVPVVHHLLDELENRLKGVLGALGHDLTALLGRVRQQAHEDASEVAAQVGQDVDQAKQAATDAMNTAEHPGA